MAQWRKILVATDFSSAGNHAVKEAVALAATYQAKLSVCTVIPDLPVTDEEMLMLRVNLDKVREYNRRKISEAKKKLERLLSPRLQQGLAVDFIVRDGKPGDEIVKLAKERKIDLIVLASHGHHGLGDLLLGSTSDRVVNKAPCSVLVVRVKKSKK